MNKSVPGKVLIDGLVTIVNSQEMNNHIDHLWDDFAVLIIHSK